MKKFFFITTLLVSNLFFAQITFEKGYYIDKTGNKFEVLIKNNQWKSNPSQIEVKSEENGKVNTISLIELKEFEVGGIKYISSNVEIDRSSSAANSLSTERNFNLKQENLTLKVLSEGEINLYKYMGGNVTRFYIKNRDEQIQPLLFKEYITDGTHIQKNEQYKEQLKAAFTSIGKDYNTRIDKISYRESDLVKLFATNENTTSKPKNKSNFNLYLKPGLGFSTYEVVPVESIDIKGTKSNSPMFKIGLEFEYVFNFNKGKWALTSEPSFQTVNHNITDFNRRNFKVNFSSLQIPISVKHYMFLNQNSKFYITAGLFSNIWLTKDQNFNSGNIYRTFSGGYNYKKFGAEIRYGAIPYFNISVFAQSPSLSMDGFNFALSYQLF